MKMWPALNTLCSDPQTEAALWSGPGSAVHLFWAQEAHFSMKNSLPAAELMGRVAAGATHQPVVLPSLLQRPGAGHLLFIV